ncbi:FAD-dependent oxidoreductase [Mucilaginibacter sp. CAU 1740]|uniref:FAD-dependent oxidoreductase n=1 Tax=Mucilaginibacter sp. CAU 1740 TaxID=3140365 RepID=UPI00325C102C
MIKKLLLVLLIFNGTLSFAETIKTDILVVGGTASGTAAAIQGARSKLKTMLIEQGPWLGGSLTSGGMCVVEGNRNLPTGIWGEFRRRVREFYAKAPGYDTAYNATLRFEPYTGAAILKKITDTVKNLTVKLNSPFIGIKKDGAGWDVSATIDGRATIIKAKVVIDATETGDVAAKAGEVYTYGFDSKKETGETLATEGSSRVQDLSWIAILKDYGSQADKTIAQPEGYDASQYACLKTKNIKQLLTDGRLPNDKYVIKWADCGNQFPVTTTDLKPENRDAFYTKARLHTLGLIYYLQTELGYKNLGIDDGFITPDHLPYTAYLREAGRATKGLIRMMLDDIYKPYSRESKLYRTAIAVGDAYPGQHYTGEGVPLVDYQSFPAYGVPLGAIVLKDLDNLLITEKAMSVTHLVNASTMYPSVQMAIGQGAGATAAFCAFFKTTTQNLNVRIIQGELLDFKAWIMPFSDIKPADPYFRAIQQIGASGLLKGVQKADRNTARLLFQPDSLVATAEVEPVLKEVYTRAFLWFNREKPGPVFTIGNLLSFISETTLTDPHTLEIGMQKAWKNQYKFSSDFDLKRPVTRREFAILANRYFNPFARTVDIAGRMVN